MKIYKALIILILAGILAVASACATGSAAQTQNLNQDKPAPDFILKDLSGNLVALSNFKGRPVFFNYWASWCPSCVDEMPLIQAAYEEWSKKGLEFFSVNAAEDLSTVQDFMQKNHYTFPVLLDSSNSVAAKYNIYYIPVSVFVGKDGLMKSRMVGAFADRAALEKQLNSFFNTP